MSKNNMQSNGGLTTVKRHGKKYMAELGRRGAAIRWQAKVGKKLSSKKNES